MFQFKSTKLMAITKLKMKYVKKKIKTNINIEILVFLYFVNHYIIINKDLKTMLINIISISCFFFSFYVLCKISGAIILNAFIWRESKHSLKQFVFHFQLHVQRHSRKHWTLLSNQTKSLRGTFLKKKKIMNFFPKNWLSHLFYRSNYLKEIVKKQGF